MYSHLSKREKKKKLAQAHIRAVLWSVQQQTISNLRNTTSIKPNQAQSTTSNPFKPNREPSLKIPDTPATSFYTPIPLSDNKTNTIKAIQQMLLDLQGQKEAIKITINILQCRLNFLLNLKTP